jgi:hypothetical protein
MRNASVVTACLFLLNAVFAIPFLVECINGDGLCIIETLGNDPCHGVRSASPVGDGPYIGSDFDPCIDLLLDAPAGLKVLTRAAISTPRWTGVTLDLPRAGAPESYTAEFQSPQSLQTPNLRPAQSTSAFSLRI